MTLVKQKHYALSRCYVTNRRTTASFISENMMLCNRSVIYDIKHLYEMALFVIRGKVKPTKTAGVLQDSFSTKRHIGA